MEAPISPHGAELGFLLSVEVQSLQYFTAGELHGFTAGAGALGASCCSVWLVPKRMFPAGMQLRSALSFAAMNCSCGLLLCCPWMLILSVAWRIVWWPLLLYLMYFKLFVEHIKQMYDSGLLVKIIGQTGCKAQRKIFLKRFPQRKQELCFSTKVDVPPSWREFVFSYQLDVFSLAGWICQWVCWGANWWRGVPSPNPLCSGAWHHQFLHVDTG